MFPVWKDQLGKLGPPPKVDLAIDKLSEQVMLPPEDSGGLQDPWIGGHIRLRSSPVFSGFCKVLDRLDPSDPTGPGFRGVLVWSSSLLFLLVPYAPPPPLAHCGGPLTPNI